MKAQIKQLISPDLTVRNGPFRDLRSYEYDELRGYDRATRRILLAEKRPAIMEWLYLTPLAG